MLDQLRHGRDVALQLFDRQRASEAVDASTRAVIAHDLQRQLHNVERGDPDKD
jgi:hypothetical protein